MKLIHLALPLVALSCAAPRPDPVKPSGTGVVAIVEEADRLRRRGDDAAAAERYREALAQEPEQVRARRGLQLLDLEAGLPLVARARARRGGDPFLAGLLEGSAARAERAFGEASEPWRSLGLAERARDAGDGPEADRRFRAVTAMDPGSVDGWLGLGAVLWARGRPGEAAEAYRHAVWLAPRHPAAWSGWAATLSRRGARAEAWRAAERAFALAPRSERAMDRLLATAERVPGEGPLRAVAARLADPATPVTVAARLRAARLHARWGETGAAERLRAEALRAGALQSELEAIESPALAAPLAEFARRFAAGTEARYRHYRATREAGNLAEFRAWARALYEETTGEALDPPGPIESFAFVGQLVDPSRESGEPLVRRLAERGLVLVLGRRHGGPPEAMLARVIRRSELETVRTRGRDVRREAIWIGERLLSGYVEWAGGGDLAGLALGRVVLIDVHAAAGWEGRLRRRRDELAAREAAIRAQEPLADTPVDSIEDPAGVADRLLLDADPDIAGEVLVHEDAHLVDADRYLPGRGSFLAALGLALESGFAAEKVLAKLERNAQLTAIVEGPDPRTALAICCASLGGRSVHARGYGEIVAGIVRLVLERPDDYPAVQRDRVVVQQLDRLSSAEIVALARELGDRWGVWEERGERATAPSTSRSPPRSWGGPSSTLRSRRR